MIKPDKIRCQECGSWLLTVLERKKSKIEIACKKNKCKKINIFHL